MTRVLLLLMLLTDSGSVQPHQSIMSSNHLSPMQSIDVAGRRHLRSADRQCFVEESLFCGIEIDVNIIIYYYYETRPEASWADVLKHTCI